MTLGLLSHLACEYESSRLSKLVIKLGLINERDLDHHDSVWSESGDRYVLKLFRDYVFHQRNAMDGTPQLDMGHIVSSLNKLDAGDLEQIVLCSRDQKDLLIVSYADVKRLVRGWSCVFADLSNSMC